MNIFTRQRCVSWLRLILAGGLASALVTAQAAPRFAGSAACSTCHAAQSSAQSSSGHAHALARASGHRLRSVFPLAASEARRAPKFRFRFDGLTVRIDDGTEVLAIPMEWAFGSGHQAVTFVSRGNERLYIEHYLTYYPLLGKFGPTPGQGNIDPQNLAEAAGLLYPASDPQTGIAGCFECHSTGGLQALEPAENGVRCEACHGPGAAHAVSGGKAAIVNPKRFTAVDLNRFCGRCHRPPASDPAKVDWSFAWNVRHQPVYLSQSACFVKSQGKLSCLTCHSPHEPLETRAESYDARCKACHDRSQRTSSCAQRDCAGCHMPRVSPEPPLRFTNHWIGVYPAVGSKLKPERR
ncbi:MAG: hypothetical protein HYX27_15320 [Acidobacteria bacterium]|nr:hypothetical protein [Acidobacteriota bacterium]